MTVAHHARPPAVDRHASERGAVIIEMTIVALFLVTMIAGSFDFGMAWRSSLAVNEGARAGARVGSGMGKVQTADRELLLSIQSTLKASGMLEEVQRVVIFDAGSAQGTVPADCKTRTDTGACHILTGATLQALTEGTALETNGCLKAAIRKQFCPLSRDDVQLNADYVGVWIQAEHVFTFRIFGRARIIERTAVMRIEPAL